MGRTESDRIIIAQIAGIASRHASQLRLTGQEREAPITELATVASGRLDLLAEYAGIVVGHHEDDVNEAHYLRVAQLCLDAGADSPGVDVDRGREAPRARNDVEADCGS